MHPLYGARPSFLRTFASLRSYTPRILTPSCAIISFSKSTICSLYKSMPSARDSTTSTSEKRSTTSPGRKSASPKITRQHVRSSPCITAFLYSQAFFTRIRRNASLISCSASRVSIRMVILDFRLMNPRPIGYPSKSRTMTISPSSTLPITLSISLSKIQSPPALMVRPSPFRKFTTAFGSTCISS